MNSRYLNSTSFSHGCDEYFCGSRATLVSASMLSSPDKVAVNHPLYDKYTRCWRIMRDSVDGQEAIRANAVEMDYIHLPPGLIEENYKSQRQGRNKLNRGALHHYINKATYIEIVSRILDEAEGRIFSKDYKLDVPEEFKAYIDNLDSEGLSFDQFVHWCVREVFTVNRFGTLVDWNEKLDIPSLKRYITESIVNWKINSNGEITLVVLEDLIEEEGQVFSHNFLKRRVAFFLEEDSSGRNYVVQRTFVKNKNSEKYEETEAPKILERYGTAISKIPFIFFGGIKPKDPMLKPLAATALDYFDAHAQYRNALWWTAVAQPYISFGEKGEFMLGPEQDEDENSEIEFIWGSMTPIIGREMTVAFAQTPYGSLENLRTRLKDIKSVMTGMGARSFNAQTASNIKAQTEKMQNRAESSVIGALSTSTSIGILSALRLAASWAQVSGVLTFELNKDFSDDFDIDHVKELIELDVIDVDDARDHVRRETSIIGKGVTNEDIEKRIRKRKLEQFDSFEDNNLFGEDDDENQETE
jgi:hypothetical protein